MLAVRTNNLFLALLVKIKVLVAYVVSKNYVVVILLIILSYTALFPLDVSNNIIFYKWNEIKIFNRPIIHLISFYLNFYKHIASAEGIFNYLSYLLFAQNLIPNF